TGWRCRWRGPWACCWDRGRRLPFPRRRRGLARERVVVDFLAGDERFHYDVGAAGAASGAPPPDGVSGIHLLFGPITHHLPDLSCFGSPWVGTGLPSWPTTLAGATLPT